MRLPAIVASDPRTYNRKFRRAIAAIRRERQKPNSGKRCWQLLSDLIGNKNWSGHNELVTSFMGVL